MGPQWYSVVEVGAACFNSGLVTKIKWIQSSFQTKYSKVKGFAIFQ